MDVNEGSMEHMCRREANSDKLMQKKIVHSNEGEQQEAGKQTSWRALFGTYKYNEEGVNLHFIPPVILDDKKVAKCAQAAVDEEA